MLKEKCFGRFFSVKQIDQTLILPLYVKHSLILCIPFGKLLYKLSFYLANI